MDASLSIRNRRNGAEIPSKQKVGTQKLATSLSCFVRARGQITLVTSQLHVVKIVRKVKTL